MISVHWTYLVVTVLGTASGIFVKSLWDLPQDQLTNLLYFLVGLVISLIGIWLTIWYARQQQLQTYEAIARDLRSIEEATTVMRGQMDQVVGKAVDWWTRPDTENTTNAVEELSQTEVSTAAKQLAEVATGGDSQEIAEAQRRVVEVSNEWVIVAGIAKLAPLERLVLKQVIGHKGLIGDFIRTMVQQRPGISEATFGYIVRKFERNRWITLTEVDGGLILSQKPELKKAVASYEENFGKIDDEYQSWSEALSGNSLYKFLNPAS